MGSRKSNKAQERKEARKELIIAQLRNCPTSPRKMRLVADMIRGIEVEKASALLQFSKKEASIRLEKLLGKTNRIFTEINFMMKSKVEKGLTRDNLLSPFQNQIGVGALSKNCKLRYLQLRFLKVLQI